MYNVALVPTTKVDDIWPHVSAGLDHSCRRTGGDLDAAYLWAECRGGHAYLFSVENRYRLMTVVGASVWRFENWTSGKKFRCLALYGEKFSEWRDDHEQLVRNAAEQVGANGLVTGGRKGWQRLFPEAKIIKHVYEVAL